MSNRQDTRLIRFLLNHALTGVVVAAMVVYGIVRLDLFGIGSLVAATAQGPLALLLLFFGLAVTFASLAMGTAIFLLPRDEDYWR